jgi:Glyoxalase-like domain
VLRTFLLALSLIAMHAPAPAFHAQVDHVVVAIRSLDEGVAAFERLTGVKPVLGGKHPKRGTENALVSLGGNTYVEVIAPQKEAKLSPLDEPMRELTELTIIGWAIGVSSAEDAHARIVKAAMTPSPITGGSRVTPAGTTLQWDTFGLLTPQIDVAPFFIHWRDGTPHPSTTSPKGCTLSKVEVQDPAAADLSKIMIALGVAGVTVTDAPSAIRVSLACPKGAVTLKTHE